MVDDFYNYVSAWKGAFAVSVESYDQLDEGEWRSDGWNGAILKSDKREKKTVELFYLKAIHAYQQEFIEANT